MSIPSLIAWLSVCILAAAWGRSLDAAWQPIWMQTGTFGLVSAVGLAIADRARTARRNRQREQALQSRAEFGLARLNDEGAALDAINAAIRRLEACCPPRDDQGTTTNEQVLIVRDLAVEITPVAQQKDGDCEFGEGMPGTVREMSARAVKFVHSQAFTGQVVVLTFHFGNSQRLSFVVDVMWTETEEAAFVTGGTVLDVGVPCDDEVDEGSPQVEESCQRPEMATAAAASSL